MKLAVVMDPIEHIKPYKDSTLALLRAAQRQQWELYYTTPDQLLACDGEPHAVLYPLKVFDSNEDWYQLGSAQQSALTTMHIVLMRVDPPFNMRYIYATYLLELAEQAGVLVGNSAAALRNCNEKLFTLQFAECCPPSMVTSHIESLVAFHHQHKEVIYKPLDQMGGATVFWAQKNEHNLNVILETLTEQGSTPIMAQRYIPEIRHGDKRIFLIDGRPIEYALARIPALGEVRANLVAGGKGMAQKLSERDYHICTTISPRLRALGLWFVGIDVIGDYLTEINVTSPTGICELKAEVNIDVAEHAIIALAEKLSS